MGRQGDGASAFVEKTEEPSFAMTSKMFGKFVYSANLPNISSAMIYCIAEHGTVRRPIISMQGGW